MVVYTNTYTFDHDENNGLFCMAALNWINVMNGLGTGYKGIVQGPEKFTIWSHLHTGATLP